MPAASEAVTAQPMPIEPMPAPTRMTGTYEPIIDHHRPPMTLAQQARSTPLRRSSRHVPADRRRSKGSKRRRNGEPATAARAPRAAAASAASSPRVASRPPRAGPTSVPALPATLRSTRRCTGRGCSRMAWAWLAVQKTARAAPCRSAPARRPAARSRRSAGGTRATIVIDAIAMRTRSVKRPSSQGSIRRPPSWVAAAVATRNPTAGAS